MSSPSTPPMGSPRGPMSSPRGPISTPKDGYHCLTISRRRVAPPTPPRRAVSVVLEAKIPVPPRRLTVTPRMLDRTVTQQLRESLSPPDPFLLEHGLDRCSDCDAIFRPPPTECRCLMCGRRRCAACARHVQRDLRNPLALMQCSRCEEVRCKICWAGRMLYGKGCCRACADAIQPKSGV